MNFDQSKKIENKIIPENKIKKGVDSIFKKNVELAKIGTKEQYSKYLDTIFPESKLKEIGYHNGEMKKFPENTGMSFFTDSLKAANKFLDFKDKDWKENSDIKRSSAVFNIKNPKIYKRFLGQSSYDLGSFDGSENNIRKLTAEEIFKNGGEIPDSEFFYRKIYRDSLIKEGYDSIITGPDDWLSTGDFPYSKQFILFNLQQIHILGSEEDLKKFKEFVSQNKEK